MGKRSFRDFTITVPALLIARRFKIRQDNPGSIL